MSNTLQNPAYYHQDDGTYAPVALMPTEEKLIETFIAKPINREMTQATVLPTQSVTPLQTNMASVISPAQPFSIFFKIIAFGASLFLMGAIAIFIYFNAHPMLYKSNGLETFELKPVLADQPELTAPSASPPTAVSANMPTVSSPEINVKNKIMDDYILSIQPNSAPPKDEVQAARKEELIAELKKESAPVSPITSVQPNVSVHESQPKNIASDEKTIVEKTAIEKSKEDDTKPTNNNILFKLVDGIANHGTKEPVCNNAMRALNQCR